jgi:hypothetical protein
MTAAVEALRRIDMLGDEGRLRVLQLLVGDGVADAILAATEQVGQPRQPSLPPFTPAMSISDVQPPMPHATPICGARNLDADGARCVAIPGHTDVDHVDADGNRWHVEAPPLPFTPATPATTAADDAAALESVK